MSFGYSTPVIFLLPFSHFALASKIHKMYAPPPEHLTYSNNLVDSFDFNHYGGAFANDAMRDEIMFGFRGPYSGSGLDYSSKQTGAKKSLIPTEQNFVHEYDDQAYDIRSRPTKYKAMSGQDTHESHLYPKQKTDHNFIKRQKQSYSPIIKENQRARRHEVKEYSYVDNYDEFENFYDYEYYDVPFTEKVGKNDKFTKENQYERHYGSGKYENSIKQKMKLKTSKKNKLTKTENPFLQQEQNHGYTNSPVLRYKETNTIRKRGNGSFKSKVKNKVSLSEATTKRRMYLPKQNPTQIDHLSLKQKSSRPKRKRTPHGIREPLMEDFRSPYSAQTSNNLDRMGNPILQRLANRQNYHPESGLYPAQKPFVGQQLHKRQKPFREHEHKEERRVQNEKETMSNYAQTHGVKHSQRNTNDVDRIGGSGVFSQPRRLVRQLGQGPHSHPGANGGLEAAVIAGAEGYRAEGYKEPQRLSFQIHGQEGPHSYRFGHDTGLGYNRQFRYEERDNYGQVKGRYGYYDQEGQLRIVNYSADPVTGYHVDIEGAPPGGNHV